MAQLLTSPISSSYGTTVFTVNDSDFKKKPVPNSDCSFEVRWKLAVLSLLSFGTAIGFAIHEQLREDHLRNRNIFTVSTFAAGGSAALLYHVTCPKALRKEINFYLNATLVEAVFFLGLIYRNTRNKRGKEIMHGVVFSELFGFHVFRNFLMKFSLSPTEFVQELEHTEEAKKLYSGCCPVTRDYVGTAIMLSWYAVVCTGLTGLYFGTRHHFTDDFNDIGVYNNGVAALSGGFIGVACTLLGIRGTEKFEKYYKGIKDPSKVLQGVQFLLRTANRNLTLFSSTAIGALLQIIKSHHSSLPTKWQIREAANSALSFALMMVVGAIYTAQVVVKKVEKEDPNSNCNKIKKVKPKEFQCKADWETCKRVIDIAFPIICAVAMMATFCTIAGMTHSEVIKGSVGGIIAAFVMMGIATYYFGNQQFEPYEETAGFLADCKTAAANTIRFLIQTPEALVPIFMWFTNKFILDDVHLKTASPTILSGMVTGLEFWAIVYVQYRMLYGNRALAPKDISYLAMMHLSNIFAEGFVPLQGNHT